MYTAKRLNCTSLKRAEGYLKKVQTTRRCGVYGIIVSVPILLIGLGVFMLSKSTSTHHIICSLPGFVLAAFTVHGIIVMYLATGSDDEPNAFSRAHGVPAHLRQPHPHGPHHYHPQPGPWDVFPHGVPQASFGFDRAPAASSAPYLDLTGRMGF